MARFGPMQTHFVNQFHESDVGHGFFLTWRTAESPGQGFGVGHRDDVDDRHFTMVIPSEHETEDGDIVPRWLTHQPGEPRGPDGATTRHLGKR